jgi:hypothetical protein
VTPATARDLATITDPAASLGQLADVLFVLATVAERTLSDKPYSFVARRQAVLLAEAAHARLHEYRPCAGGCRRQVWPACGELCEECRRREEKRDNLLEAAAIFEQHAGYERVARWLRQRAEEGV